MTAESQNEPGSRPATGERIQAMWQGLRQRLEGVSALPSEVMDRIEESLHTASDRLDDQAIANRAKLRTWTGLPSPKELDAMLERLGNLETRLARIETDVQTLEAHREEPPCESKPSPANS